MTLREFKEDIYEALANKPKQYRKGQFVFNYIDCVYGVARDVQYKDKVDCFHDDTKIDEFIKLSAE